MSVTLVTITEGVEEVLQIEHGSLPVESVQDLGFLVALKKGTDFSIGTFIGISALTLKNLLD